MTETAPRLVNELTPTDGERLAQATNAVRDHCGWHIAPVLRSTYVFDTPASALVFLPTLELVEVESVAVDGGDPLELGTLVWNNDGALIPRRGYAWPGSSSAPRRMTVTFTHGFAEAPPAVAGVVQAVAQRAIDNPKSKLREQTGPFADSPSQTAPNQAAALALLDSERQLLAPYMLVVFA